MDFGPLPTAEVSGCVLGHTLRLPNAVFKKGRVLSLEDVQLIAAAGHRSVTVARLDADDVLESDAASRIASSLCGPGIVCEEPFTGRVNLRAAAAGVLKVDVETARALLSFDEGLTFATLAPDATVWADQLVATAKVIPFSIPERVLAQWEGRAKSSPPCLHVALFRTCTVAFVQTRLPGTHESVLDRASASMKARVTARGSTMPHESRCAHEVAAVAEALVAAVANGADLIAVLGASQIADRSDVIPRAIVEAGGTVHRFGLPVDPGNLTLIASLGDMTVLGVPGCARSLRPSGFDRVLDRTLTGTPPAEIDAASLGVGGLMKEIVSRPQPRDRS